MHHYHCHSTPLADHIAKGLYGMFIVDPKQGRPKADELVMVMNGFDTNFDRENEIYAVNTVAFEYERKPIRVKRGELVRIYLLNILEFDLMNSFHIHANFFDVYPTGTSLKPTELTDTIIQGQGQRAVLELRFPYTGKYMFHAHVSEFAELGLDGLLRGGRLMEAQSASAPRGARLPGWLAGLLPLALLGRGHRAVRRARRPRPGRSPGRARSRSWRWSAPCCGPGEIELHVRNDGPDPVAVRQVIVNDGFSSFSQTSDDLGRLGGDTIRVQYPWVEGEAYELKLLTATGATVDHTHRRGGREPRRRRRLPRPDGADRRSTWA